MIILFHQHYCEKCTGSPISLGLHSLTKTLVSSKTYIKSPIFNPYSIPLSTKKKRNETFDRKKKEVSAL
jgi:hypothetical protein